MNKNQKRRLELLLEQYQIHNKPELELFKDRVTGKVKQEFRNRYKEIFQFFKLLPDNLVDDEIRTFEVQLQNKKSADDKLVKYKDTVKDAVTRD